MTTSGLVVVGCGRMGGALLKQWLMDQRIGGRVYIMTRSPLSDSEILDHESVSQHTDLRELTGIRPAMILLAVKPQQLPAIIPHYAERFGIEPLYLSIAAGIPLPTYATMLGEGARVVRMMPNMPVTVGMGMSSLCASAHVNETDRSYIEKLVKITGECVWLEDESLFDAATAIAGSGPAYVFYFMECLIAAAIDAGLDEDTARKLVLHTVHGSAEQAFLSKASLAELREQVTSPGGTTEAALSRLMSVAGMLPMVQDTVKAAIDRANKLAS